MAPPEPGVFIVLGAVAAAWVCVVLAMVLPSSSERAGDELARRLAHFRHQLNTIGDQPRRADILRLMAHARELGLAENELSVELEELRACLAAIDLRAGLDTHELPTVAVPNPLPDGDRCVFMVPARFGRRRSDQFGHLMLTMYGVRFRGAIDTAADWADVRSVQRVGRELVVATREGRRQLRFACHSVHEAMQAGVYAEHLRAHAAGPAATARPDVLQS